MSATTMTQQVKSNLTQWLVNENDYPSEGNMHDKLQFLIRYAVLAQSFYNSQPWEFSVEDSQINVYAKLPHWLKASDPEQRELYISIGCALENLLIAAEHFRFGHQVSRFPEPGNNTWVARVTITTLSQSSALRSPALFGAITKRHTHHHSFDPQPLQKEHLQTVKKFMTEEDIWLEVTDDSQTKAKIAQYAAHANTILFADEQFRKELSEWARKGVFGIPWFQSVTGKISTRESGLQGGSTNEQRSKNQTMKQEYSEKMFLEQTSSEQALAEKAFTEKSLAKRLNQQEQEILQTAPLLAVLSSPFDNHMIHVIAGQIYEKLCLESALLGIRCLPLNQLIEVPESRIGVHELFPSAKGKPLLVFAMGYAQEEMEKEWTPRLPIEQVLHH